VAFHRFALKAHRQDENKPDVSQNDIRNTQISDAEYRNYLGFIYHFFKQELGLLI